MSRPARQSNFEVLRVLAMFLVVVFHYHWNTNVAVVQPGSPVGWFNWLFSQSAFVLGSCAVDTFLLISGYFLIEKDFNWKRMIRLWVQTAFYTTGIWLLAYFITPEQASIKNVLDGLHPIGSECSLFVTWYFGMVLLAPFLSKAVSNLTKQQYKLFLLVLVFVSCTFAGGFPYGNLYGYNRGYGMFWYITLFFVAGYLRRFDTDKSERNDRLLFWSVFGCVVLWCAGKGLIKHFVQGAPLVMESPAYNGFASVLAVALFLRFKGIHFKDSAVVRGLVEIAPFTFGVYLIHDHPWVRNIIWSRVPEWGGLDSPVYIPVILIFVALVFVVCMVIDFLRAKLFQFAGVDKVTQKMAEFCESMVEKYIK